MVVIQFGVFQLIPVLLNSREVIFDLESGCVMEIHIPCPKCGRELKLRDRSLLGRKGKCPKCAHAFVLEEPAAVELELAEPEPKAVGRWLPEGGVASAVVRPKPAAEFPKFGAPVSNIPVLGDGEGAAARLKALQKKNAKRRNVGMVVGAIVVLAVGGVSYYAVTNAPRKPVPDQQQNADLGKVPAGNAEEHVELAGKDEVKSTRPTKGEKIELQFIPFGTQVMINIRPAELWQAQSRGEEFRYCIPPLAALIEKTFMEYFKRKPEQIEEAMICLIPGPQGTLPEVAAVIHLVEEAKKSQLLDDFGGMRVEDYDYPVYISGERAYLIADQKTVAVCSRAVAGEMVSAVVGRNPAPDGIDELLPLTDRDRHFTMIFVPRTIRLHAGFWFPENVKPFIMQACNWFGDEVESAAWSLHLDEKSFYSEMFLRTTSGITSANLERETRKKLSKLPYELLENVQKMSPKEAGKRKLIGRLPKMTEVVSLASKTSHEARYVHVVTPLPERAAPNLALASILAWDESTRTDFTKEKATKPSSDEPKLPDLIADRLKLKIDIDFRRTPLQDAFAYIGGEIKTMIDIDGDALKAGGFTKNMPQTFKEDKISAVDGIWKVLERYQDPAKPAQSMVMVIDEANKKVLISTAAVAEQQKLTPYVFKK